MFPLGVRKFEKCHISGSSKPDSDDDDDGDYDPDPTPNDSAGLLLPDRSGLDQSLNSILFGACVFSPQLDDLEARVVRLRVNGVTELVGHHAVTSSTKSNSATVRQPATTNPLSVSGSINQS